MSAQPKISVIIPCFNHGKFLPEAVASVVDAKRNDVELIVVDDGSTDTRTLEEMDALRARRIKVLRQENRGLAAARNAGITASSGEYILPLDADNRVRPAYFEHGIRILDTKPQMGVVYGDAEYIGERAGPWRVGPFDRNRLLNWNFIDACAIYRRKVWEQNGGYDGTMPVQGLEDWDFWLSTLEHGWEFAFVPEVLFDYRVSAGSMITCTLGFEPQIEQFVARKHGCLYWQAWLALEKERQSLLWDRQSVKWTLRNLHRLLKARIRQRLQADGRPSDR